MNKELEKLLQGLQTANLILSLSPSLSPSFQLCSYYANYKTVQSSCEWDIFSLYLKNGVPFQLYISKYLL